MLTTREPASPFSIEGDVAIVVMLHLQKYTFVCIILKMKSGEIIAALQKDGWYEVATKGSHVQFKHPDKPGRVTVPHPKRDIPIGTLKSIEKQAGLKLR